MKKYLVLIAAAMVAGAAVAATETVDGITWTYTVSGGEATIGSGNWGEQAIPSPTPGEVVVPTELAGCPVTRIGAHAFYNCSKLTFCKLPCTVTSIGDYAFYCCAAMTSISIPSSVTNIGKHAFLYCRKLSDVVIPSNITCIEESMFYGCSGLMSVTIPNTVTNIAKSAFYGCSGLTSVTIPNGVTTIGADAFRGCSGLTSVTIPNGVTTIGACAFYDCSGLTSVAIPNTVTAICSSTFANCSGLVNLPMTENVTNIYGGAFSNCKGLSSVVIPSNVVSVGDAAFYGCNGLMSITISEGVMHIGAYAFRNCSMLTSATIPASVVAIGDNPFAGCDGLKQILVSDENSYYASMDGYLVTKDKKTLIAGCSNGDVTIPFGVENIRQNAFRLCGALTSITIPDSVTNIEDWAFGGCNNLKYVDFSNSLKNIGGSAFLGCAELTSIVVPSSVTNIGAAAFADCSELRSVAILAEISQLPERIFQNCSNLEKVVLPASLRFIAPEKYKSSTYKNGAFYGCANIKCIVFNGPPMSGYGYTQLQSQSNDARIMYKREYAQQWKTIFALTRFGGFSSQQTNSVRIISTSIRSDDPSVLDVVYKVKSDKPTVKVRAVAYIDGVRSFSNIVRMENLVDGTKASVSDTVTANEEHTISWKASEDLNVDLAKVKVEVLAVETQLLPLEMIRIPAIGDKKAMELSWNVHTKDQLFDALLWLYADKTSGLTLTNGILYGDGKPLLEGADFYTTVTKQDPYYPEYSYQENTYHSDDAIGFIFKQMGYSVLTGDALTYANKMTRLGLTVPDTYYGEKNYAYRWIDGK